MESSESECGLVSLPTETLVDIVSQLTAYDKLCLRITCKRLYSIVSDSRSWFTLIWMDCRRKDVDFKALRLALRLSSSHVQKVSISYPRLETRFPMSKFLPQVHGCKQVRELKLTGMVLSEKALSKLMLELPSLQSLTLDLNIGGGINSLSLSEIIDCAVVNSRSIQVLKVLEAHLTSTAWLYHWETMGYMPPMLQISYSATSRVLESLKHLQKSSHPAKLSIYPHCSSAIRNPANKYPILEVSMYPTIEVTACSMFIHSRSTMLALCSEGTPELCVSATLVPNAASVVSEVTLPLLPATIRSLCLAGLSALSSTDLSRISDCCPNLVCTDLRSCPNALSSLEGLGDIGVKCKKLMSLNLRSIPAVESVAMLWEILAGMKRLRHLSVSKTLCMPERTAAPKNEKGSRVSHVLPFDEHSLSRIRNSATRMTLIAFEVTYIHPDEQALAPYQLQLEPFLPAFQYVQHFRIVECSPDLTNVLPHMPHLTYLFVEWSSYHRSFKMPVDPACYRSLRKLWVWAESLQISKELIQALAYSRLLSTTYFTDITLTSQSGFSLEDFPRLTEFTTHFPEKKDSELDSRGIIGQFTKFRSSTPRIPSSHDLRSLWPSHY